ncbi:hypothetical protein ABEB36_008336 [Hypothenemus hampei]|uniref:Uncharacterized protein n=1 Tax=Hypothenemus hampei TaxID=57062 RepID=A0ABD1ELI3_HYPHA
MSNQCYMAKKFHSEQEIAVFLAVKHNNASVGSIKKEHAILKMHSEFFVIIIIKQQKMKIAIKHLGINGDLDLMCGVVFWDPKLLNLEFMGEF